MINSKISKKTSLVRLKGKRIDLSKITQTIIENTSAIMAHILLLKKGRDVTDLIVCLVSNPPLGLSDIEHLDVLKGIKESLVIVNLSTLPLTKGGTVDEALLQEQLEEAAKNKQNIVSNIKNKQDFVILLKEVKSSAKAYHVWDFQNTSKTKNQLDHLVGSTKQNLWQNNKLPLAHTKGANFKFPTDAPTTLKSALLETAEKYPDRGIQFLLIDDQLDFISYKELVIKAKKALSVFQKNNVKPGEAIIISTNDNRAFIETYWGCILGGILPTPVGAINEFLEENTIVQRLVNAWKLLDNPLVVTDNGNAKKLKAIPNIWDNNKVNVIEAETFNNATASEDLFDAQPDSPVLHLLTSGSTGVPKCIMHRNYTVINRMHISRYQDKGLSDSVSLNFLPMDHVGGSLMFHARDVYFGYHQVNARVEKFIENPLRLLDWVDQYKVNLTWGANFVFVTVNQHEQAIKAGNWNLKSLHHIMNAAEAVTNKACKQFLKILKPFGLPNSAMQPSFGMSEIGSCILLNNEMRTGDLSSGVAVVEKRSMSGKLSFKTRLELDKLADKVTDKINEDAYAFLPHCGKIGPGNEARIIDIENKVVPEAVIGRLQIKGITVMDGYVKNPEANKEAFVGDGWFNTGDLGFILNENVYITGREKDLIIINGANFLSFEIETIIEEVSGVKSTFSAAVGIWDPIEEKENLIIAYVPNHEHKMEQEIETITNIKSHVLKSFGIDAAYIIPVKLKDFPKTISGKIQRAKIKSKFNNGGYKPIIKEIDIHQKNSRTLPNWFVAPSWELSKLTKYKRKSPFGRRLIFAQKEGDISALIKEDSIVVFKGQQWSEKEQDGNLILSINPNDKKDYAKLVTTVGENQISELVYLWQFCPVNEQSENPLTELHTIFQAFQNCFTEKTRLLIPLLDQGKEQPYVGLQSALFGYIETLSNETEALKGQIVIFDNQEKQVFIDINNELGQPITDTIIAWRNYNRFAYKLKAVDKDKVLKGISKNDPILKPEQTWGITGGFGGIGQLIVPHLLKKYKINLILLERNALTETRKKIVADWQEIGNLSSQIVDITNKKAIDKFFKSREIPLDGVVHLAGASVAKSFTNPESTSIFNQEKQYIDEQWAVKVSATNHLLDALNAQAHKSNLVLFSSVNAYFGGNGFSTYSAVTSYQSELTNQLTKNTKVLAIDWSGWDQIGMNSGNTMMRVVKQKGFMSINTVNGLRSFDLAMQLGWSRLMVGLDRTNLFVQQRLIKHKLNIQTVLFSESTTLSNEIKETIKDHACRDWFSNLPTVVLPSIPRLKNGNINEKLLLSYDNGQKEHDDEPIKGITQEKLAILWGDVLEIEINNAKSNFFELGGHSIKAIQLLSKINESFGVNLMLVDLFQAPSLKLLADLIALPKTDIKIQLPIEKQPKQKYYPLSSAQKRIWALSELESNSSLYNILGAWRIKGNINTNRLKTILKNIVESHQSFSLGFVQIEGEPRQFEKQNAEIPLEVIDFSNLTESVSHTLLDDLIIQESKYEFDLEKDDLTHVKVIKVKEEEHVLLIAQHHIISDGVSLNTLLEEFAIRYTTQDIKLESNRINYTDFVSWEQNQEYSKSKTYWQERIKDHQKIVDFPIDKVRPPLYSYHGDTITDQLPSDLNKKLRALAKKQQTTLYNVLMTAYASFLGKITGTYDVLIATPVAGRHHKDVDTLIGMFVNTLPIRVQINEENSFTKNLEGNSKQISQDLAHGDYPFDQLLSDLDIDRDLSRPPVTQTLFNFLSTPLVLDLGGTKGEQINVRHKVSKYELSVQVLDQKESLTVSFEYNTSLFEEESIRNLKNVFIEFLNQIVANPQQNITEHSMLSESEKRKVLFDFNQTATAYPKDSNLHEQFAIQAHQNPNALAVEVADRTISYSELYKKVESWAGALQGKGINSGDVVAVCAKSSLEMAIALLATQQIGAIYLPIDYELPVERRHFILNDANAKVMLIQPDLLNDLEWETFETIVLEEEPEERIKSTIDRSKIQLSSKNGCYICYTSGSTGMPKGVQIPHLAVLRLVKNNNFYKIKSTDKFISVANFAFDAFTFEFWGALLNGAAYTVVEKEDRINLAFLSQFISEKKITVTFLTVTLFNQLIEQYPDCISQLNCLLVGGEALSVPHIKKALKYLPKGLFNGYGPTENTTFSNVYPIDKVKEKQFSIPLGKPIGNSRCYVLDKHMQPVPVGVVGEIYLAGDGLAKGYLNRPELSEESFLTNLEVDKGKIYKSGDLGCWTQEGLLEYRGRTDAQVKIRGYRIECGEIEHVIMKLCHGKNCAVLPQVDDNQHKKLVAYITDPTIEFEVLKEQLKVMLPSYMVPSAFMFLNELPLTHTNKLDVKRLPEITVIKTKKDSIQPETELQKTLHKKWKEVLKVEEFGIHDSFFDLGGDSIIAVSLIGKLQRVDLPLDPKMIFMYQTIAELANAIENGIHETKRTRTEKDYLIKLADGKQDEARIYFLPPAGGTLMGYIELSRNIKHQGNIYGLQGPGLFPDEDPQFLSYEQLLDIFERVIEGHYRPGIDYLAGHSLGGHLAFGLAQRLEKQGKPIKGLLILDTVPDMHVELDKNEKVDEGELKMLALVLGMGHMVGLDPDQFKGMKYEEAKTIILEKAREDKAVKAFMDNEYLDKYLTIQINHMVLSQMMKLDSSPLEAPISVFQTQEHTSDFMERFQEWQSYAKQPVNIIPIKGNHVTMMRRPYVEKLGEKVVKVIQEKFNMAALPN